MLDRLRLWLNDDIPKSGHEYVDVITGERIQITSVQKRVIQISSAREDSESRNVERDTFLKAYRLGFIKHANDCYHCENRR